MVQKPSVGKFSVMSDHSTGTHESESPKAKSFSSDICGDQLTLRKNLDNTVDEQATDLTMHNE